MENEVAIKVENQREFKALMKYYQNKKHWITIEGNQPVSLIKRKVEYVAYHNEFTMVNEATELKSRMYFKSVYKTIIPFAHLAAIEGIELEPEEVVIEIVSRTVTVSSERAVFNEPIEFLSKKEVEEIFTALKSFEK